jgi:hypothetical protein
MIKENMLLVLEENENPYLRKMNVHPLVYLEGEGEEEEEGSEGME